MRFIHRLRDIGLVLLLILSAAGCSEPGPITEAGAGDFRSEDGFLLDGTLFGSGDKAVVLTHMSTADQQSWRRFAEELADDGFLVLTFDFRGYGRSQGAKSIGSIDRDVRGAVRYLRSARDVRSVVLVGASMGGTAALMAGADTEVSGVATLSAPTRFKGLDAIAVVSKVEPPKLFMASLEDGSAADAAKELLKKAVDPASDIHLSPGDAHGTDMLDSRQGEEVRTVLKRFIAEVSA